MPTEGPKTTKERPEADGPPVTRMATDGAPDGTATISSRVRDEWAEPITRFAFAAVLATAVALWSLARVHVVARQPLWLLVTALGAGYLLTWIVQISYDAAPSRRRMHARVVAQMVVAAIVMYLTGWGPALGLGYVFVARYSLTRVERPSWRSIAAVAAACMVVGQAAVSLGLAPSIVGKPDEYGLAALTGLGALFVIALLGISAEQLARSEGSLARSEKRLRTTLETANDAYIEIDENGVVTDWNANAEALFGWSRNEAIGRNGEDLVLPAHERDASRHQAGLTKLAATGEEPLMGTRYELLAQNRDGRTFPVELAFWRTKDVEGVRFHAFAHDITERKDAEAALRKSQEQFYALFARHPHPMWVYDGQTLRFVEVNEAALTHYGYSREEFLSMTIEQIRPPEDMVRLTSKSNLLREDFEMSGPRRHQTKAGVVIEVDIASHRLTFDGRDCVLVMAQDISERRRLEDELRHQALHDVLTGLPNRLSLLERAEHLLTQSHPEGSHVAALFLDIDNFKEVNDSFGHIVGDELLQAVASRLSAAADRADTVGRIGGDEFVVLLAGTGLDADPETMSERLLTAIRAAPFSVEGRDVTVTASIGIAIGDDCEASDLLRNADVALYQAKERGKNCSALFLPEMQLAVHERLETAIQLHAAIENREFELLFQPIVDLGELQLCGVEALIRWRHPTLGRVSPDRFIPLAEEIGLIDEIGRWVLDEACQQAAKWRRSRPWMTVAVNVSAVQLASDRFVDFVRASLSSSGLDPRGLTLEITESILMEEGDASVRRLRQLRELGVRLALDDFGTGFSSLNYLRQLPVDTMKIDRSFMSTVTTSAPTAALVHTLIQLGEALNLEVIAEGVERLDQLRALQEAACPKAQGFLFSRPIPVEGIDRLLGSGRSMRVSAPRETVNGRDDHRLISVAPAGGN